MFDDLDWVCECPLAPCPGCVCTRNEMALRRYTAVSGGPLRPMTAAERAWCVAEADHCGEGLFSVEELSALDDRALAAAVLRAWTAYVRRNGPD